MDIRNKTNLLSAIVAMSLNRVIGNHNQLPWYLPADLAHFKAITLHKTIIMGRKTFESIGKPLPQRKNIIITHNKRFKAENCEVYFDAKEVLTSCTDDEMIIIGGAEIYRYFLPYLQKIYLTLVHHSFEGDTFFPELPSFEWEITEQKDYHPDEKNPYPYSFLVMQRTSPI